jgi:ParB/RepB/Spo0J family partition protein
MPPRKDPTLAEIRARVARRDSVEQPAAPTAASDSDAIATATARFYGSVEQLIQNRTVQRIQIGHIAPDVRPDMRQPRLLPLPEDLLADGEAALGYRDLVADLRALGLSMKERQIQPIVVYPGTSSIYPAARYLILIGHRRWTSAHLVGLETLDAIVVEPPTNDERVHLQYVENDEREDFSDMERAWALQQLRQALGDSATWEDVEARLRMSNARRNQLTRLLAFKPSQQVTVARLRLQETQVRPLHAALRNGSLTHDHVDTILQRLSEIAIERTAAQAAAAVIDSATGAGLAPRRAGIDGPTIARLAARAQRASTSASAEAAPPTPRWLPLLLEQLMRTNQGVQRAAGRAELLGPTDMEALLTGVGQLITNLTGLMARMQAEGEAVEGSYSEVQKG